MNNIQPWCVSRQLWWGHRIPAWFGPDKKIFVDYLITNMKLYFDKFEGELATELSEPTTPEYEQAKTSI